MAENLCAYQKPFIYRCFAKIYENKMCIRDRVDTFGTGKLADEEIAEIVKKEFDLRPTAIIKELDLRKPIYRQLAAYGHLGREDLQVKWESIEPAERLKKYL